MSRKRGKKIDVITIVEGAQRHEVDLRLDHDRDEMFAELGGVELSAKTLSDLKDKLQARAKQLVDYKFKWYIEIRFGVSRKYHSGGLHSWGSSGVDDMKEVDTEDLCGIDLDFKVIERSQGVPCDSTDYRDRPQLMFMERVIEEKSDGTLEGTAKHEARRHTVGEDKENAFVEYTPDRYEKLRAIRAGLFELAKRLDQIVGGDNAQKTMTALDKMPSGAVLQLGPVTKKVLTK